MLVNQPLVMPPRIQALATLSDQIGGLACTAYFHLRHARRAGARQDHPPCARQTGLRGPEHALHYAAHKVVLALNLQLPIESRTWSTLHQTYLLGERYRLTELTVPAASGGESTIRNTWLVPLLLACCQTGQLLRSDIAVLHAALRASVAGCRLRPGTDAEGLFAVDLNGTSPPVYRSSMAMPGKQVRLLDTSDFYRLGDKREGYGTQGEPQRRVAG